MTTNYDEWNKVACDGKNKSLIQKSVDVFADNVIYYTVN